MRSILALTVVAFLGYGIIDAAPANAEKFFNPSGPSANWDDNVWNSTSCSTSGSEGPPASTEAATICDGHVAQVDDTGDEALRVTLESPTGENPTRIDIDPDAANATLTLGSGEIALTSTIEADSEIRLMDDPSEGTNVARLKFVDVDHLVTGAGEIVGQDSLAVIDVPPDAGDELESRVTIKGALKISGAGDFLNNGTVLANLAGGTLDMLVSGTLYDTCIASAVTNSNYRWGVNHATATLRFNQDLNDSDSNDLFGHFWVNAGVLRMGTDSPADDIDLAVRRDLLHEGGSIVVGTNDSIAFNVADCPAP